MRTLIIVGLMAVGLMSCADAQTEGTDGTIHEVVDAKEFYGILENNDDAQLIDLRTDGEVTGGMILGATQIDWNADGALDKLKALDKDAPLLLYCASGGRSGRAMKALQAAGFKEMYDLKGGFGSWRSAGLPTE